MRLGLGLAVAVQLAQGVGVDVGLPQLLEITIFRLPAAKFFKNVMWASLRPASKEICTSVSITCSTPPNFTLQGTALMF